MANNQRQKDDNAIQRASLQELKQLTQDMQPSGKVNDIHAVRLFLLGIIAKIEELEKQL